MIVARKSQVHWYGDQFLKRLRIGSREGLERAAMYHHLKCREAVNVGNTSEPKIRKRDTVAGKKGSQYSVYPNPSKPGEPPRKRTGHGQTHVQYETNGSLKDPRARVGVDKAGLYMAFLELGTDRVARRPWLIATMRKYWGVIARLAATGGKRRIR